MSNPAYMLKIFSLTGNPHNLEFLRKSLESLRDIYLFGNKE